MIVLSSSFYLLSNEVTDIYIWAFRANHTSEVTTFVSSPQPKICFVIVARAHRELPFIASCVFRGAATEQAEIAQSECRTAVVSKSAQETELKDK